MLRDRLVCRINNSKIQKLLTESSNKLTFKWAQELAESAKAAEKSITMSLPLPVLHTSMLFLNGGSPLISLNPRVNHYLLFRTVVTVVVVDIITVAINSRTILVITAAKRAYYSSL